LDEVGIIFVLNFIKPHVNTFADMHDIGDQLLQSGFQSPVMEMETLTLTYQSVTDLLRDLKAIGAQTVSTLTWGLLSTTAQLFFNSLSVLGPKVENSISPLFFNTRWHSLNN
jgi:hypothetical protein